MSRGSDIISIFDSLGQLKRFHHLFRYEVATYEDGVDDGVEAMDTLFGCSVVTVSFMDWARNYS